MNTLQFFVRTFSADRRTIVIRANSDDPIASVLDKIEYMIGIPSDQQRLLYQGRQLQQERTLAETNVQNDVVLQLVGRLRSSRKVEVLELVNDVVNNAISVYKSHHMQASVPEHSSSGVKLKELIYRSVTMARDEIHDINEVPENLEIFSDCSGPQALVMLYACPSEIYGDFGSRSVNAIIGFIKRIPGELRYLCMPVVVEFCMLLHRVKGIDDSLYLTCRDLMKEQVEYMPDNEEGNRLVFCHLIPFIVDLASDMSRYLEDDAVMPRACFLDHVGDFCTFVVPVTKRMKQHIKKLGGPFKFPFSRELCGLPVGQAEEIICLHRVFVDLLSKVENKLLNDKVHQIESIQYFMILRELNSISKLYHGCQKLFCDAIIRRKDVLCNLIIKYAHADFMEEVSWILELKEATKFELRRELVLMMLPKLKTVGRKYRMLIDRSKLFSVSFQYIGNSNPKHLHKGLSMQFKDEEAYGFGVLREWFLLVCQAIFKPKNGLFRACPGNLRRFFPNAESEEDPLRLQYFRFSGRVIALALMHRIQVGIALDRVFFLQLAGQTISLDNIQDADPVLYSSCMKILEMDPAILDTDELGLTFSHEIEKFGSRKVVELCPSGSNIPVNSENRKQYVDSLIKQVFVTAISEQVAHFAEGFLDIMRSTGTPKYFFQSLYLEDLDLMLHGAESEICVDDWRAHTDYNGYKVSDRHISWFWEIVREMNKEQKRNLLFFWTSIKYLPFEGFSGLSSRLCIVKTSESSHHLPSSSTCFYQLHFPCYHSFNVMRDRIHAITEEHMSCSFGTD